MHICMDCLKVWHTCRWVCSAPPWTGGKILRWLEYQGIFNCRIAFCDGHWVPFNRQPRTETVIPNCQVVEEKAPANCFAKQITAWASGLASSSLLHIKRCTYTDTAGHAHQQQLQDLVIKQGDSGDDYCQMFISKGKHIKNVFEPDFCWALSLVVKKFYFSTKEVSKRWAVHPMPSTEHEMGYLLTHF